MIYILLNKNERVILIIILYYKWELIPKRLILDNLNHIINNYYNETNFFIFQTSLNMNYRLYIQNKMNELNYEEIQNLLSKLIIINFIYNERKYWNI